MDAEMKAKREAKAALELENGAPEEVADDTAGPTDLLAAEDDEDLIF